MIVVVSDTSPLRYLILVEQVEVLPRLFDHVLVLPAILLEMCQARTPGPLRAWAASPPAWLTVREPSSLLPQTLDRLTNETNFRVSKVTDPIIRNMLQRD